MTRPTPARNIVAPSYSASSHFAPSAPRTETGPYKGVPWSPEQVSDLKRLVGLPERLTPASRAERTHVSLSELCRVLDLDPSGIFDLARDGRWLMGGRILRWLRRGPRNEGDFDLFLPSPEDVDVSMRELLRAGHRFYALRGLHPTCPLCGRRSQRVGKIEDPRHQPKPRILCPSCGDVGELPPSAFTAETLAPITTERVAENRLVVVELESPDGMPVQLNLVYFGEDLAKLSLHADYSICQLASDGRDLYFGPQAFTDLLLGRLRLIELGRPVNNMMRMKKYYRAGFKPYFGTFWRVLAPGFSTFLLWKLRLIKPA